MKNVVVVIPRDGDSSDLHLEARGEIPLAIYEHIELDKFKTIYRRKGILESLRDGWTFIETTDLVSIMIMRVMRMKDEINSLIIISNEGLDEIDENGRHLGTISECEGLLDWALGELVAGKAK